MTPGTRLRAWAKRWCSTRTTNRFIDPVIADMQHEYATAVGAWWERLWIVVKGYVAFWKMVAFCASASGATTLRSGWDDAAVRRALGSAGAVVFLLTGLLSTPPLLQSIGRNSEIVWPFLLLLPQALPLSLPVSLLVGVVYGLHGRTGTGTVRRIVVIVGLLGSIASCATITWLVPAANQAFRVTVARQVVVRGMNEVSPLSIREQAVVDRNEGRLDRAGVLLFAFHARWALVGAALAFALFGLGINALRIRPTGCVAICLLGSAVYVSYFFELGSVSPSIFSDEPIAVALAWLPNVLLLATSLACLSAQGDLTSPSSAV